MKTLLILILTLFFGLLNSSAQQFDFGATIGSSLGIDEGYNINVDLGGNIYVVGRFEGTVDFDPIGGSSNTATSLGSTDAFCAKYDPSGYLIWVQTFGGGSDDDARSVAINSMGEVFVTGSYASSPFIIDMIGGAGILNEGGQDTWLAKLDVNGYYIWGFRISSTGYDFFPELELTQAGNVAIYGQFGAALEINPFGLSTTLTPSGGNDGVVIEYDATSGGLISYFQLGEGGDFVVNSSFAIDPVTDDYYIGAHFSGVSVDVDPGAATFAVGANGGYDLFVGKYTQGGNLYWAVTMGGTNNENLTGLEIDGGGDIYITGNYEGTFDIDPSAGVSNLFNNGNQDVFIAKLSTNGALGWAHSFGSPNEDIPYGIDVDPIGDVYIVGGLRDVADMDPSNFEDNVYLMPAPTGQSSTFMAKYASNGNYLWGCAVGSTSSDYGSGLHVDAANNLYVTGSMSGDGDWDWGSGNSSFIHSGGTDGWFAKYSPCVHGDIPIVNPGNSLTICEGDSAIMTVAGSTLNDNTAWYWYTGTAGEILEDISIAYSDLPLSDITYYIRSQGECAQHGTVDSVEVTVLPAPTLIVAATVDTLCSGSTNISATGNGLSYTWNNGLSSAQTHVVSPAVSTNYIVSVDNASGCTREDTINVTVLQTPSISVATSTILNPTCYPLADGSIDIDANGFGIAIQYSIDNGNNWYSSNSFTNLPSGVYPTMITNNYSGCTDLVSITLTNSDTIIVAFPLLVSPTCADSSNGEIEVSLTGGTAPYAASLSGIGGLPGTSISSSHTFTNLPGGNNSFICEDVAGCQSAAASVNLFAPNPIQYDLIGTDECSPILGSIEFDNVVGGTSTFDFSINAGANWYTDSLFSNVPVGTYSLSVRDGNGCVLDSLITISSSNPAQPVISANNPYCFGEGLASSNGSGTISWYNQSGTLLSTGNTISLSGAISDGDYLLAIDFFGGCKSTADSVQITAPQPVEPDITDSNPYCSGIGTISATGNVITWLDQSNNVLGSGYTISMPTSITNGDYIYAIDSLNGCASLADSVLIIAPFPTDAAITANNPYCEGQGLISATGDGNITWLDNSYALVASGASIALPSTIGDGEYIYAVNTLNGCEGTRDSVLISLIINDLFVTDDQEVCLGDSASIKAGNASGGSFTWLQDGTIADATVAETMAAPFLSQYYIVSLNNNGCVFMDSMYVTVTDCDEETVIPSAFSPNGDGVNETWIIEMLTDYPENVVVLYDRWGSEVKTFDNYDNADVSWDGTNTSGNQLAAGTYYYYIQSPALESAKTGWVQLTR